MTADAPSRPTGAAVTRRQQNATIDVLLLALIFLTPKIDIIVLSAGSLRLDDLLLVIVAVRHISLCKQLPVWLRSRIQLVAGTTALSAVIAVGLHRTGAATTVLYAVRPFEYMIAVLLGFSLARHGKEFGVRRVLTAVAVLSAILSVLQARGYAIGVSDFSYGRAAGNLGGPYELAAVCGVLLFYFLEARMWVSAVIIGLPLILSASRITVLACVVVLFAATRGSLPKAAKPLAVAMLAAVLGAVLLLPQFGRSTSGDSLVQRLETTSIVAAARAGCDYSLAIEPIRSQQEYLNYAYTRLGTVSLEAGGDASAQVRFSRWCLLANGLRSPDRILLGYGPSFAGAAVDGQFMRYVVEVGLIGLLAWLALWVAVWRHLVGAPRNALSVLLITAVFIDILTAARPTVLLWVLVGLVLGRAHNKEPKLPTSTTPTRNQRGVRL